MTRIEVQHAYFLAAGWSLEVTNRFRDERKAQFAAAKAYVREVGGPNAKMVRYSHCLAGFVSPIADIPGWRLTRLEGISQLVWVPNKRSKLGREADERIKREFLFPGQEAYTNRIGLKTFVGPGERGLLLYSAAYEVYTTPAGEQVIIHVPWRPGARDEETNEPLGQPQEPRDALRLKTSEYHQIVEAHQELQKARHTCVLESGE